MELIVLAENLIISNNVKNQKQITENIKNNVFKNDVFLVCLNNSSQNFLDIYYSPELNKPFVNINSLTVIAVCCDKADAKQTCVSLLKQFIDRFNNLDNFKDKVGMVRWYNND